MRHESASGPGRPRWATPVTFMRSTTHGTAHSIHGDLSYASGQEALDELWKGDDRPDAIFCVNDLIAYGVLDAARVKGIQIPEGLWVIGYNGLTMSGWAAYDLTTVQQPIERMAEISVDLLMKRIDGAHASLPQRRRLKGELIVRGSTA